MKTDQKYSRLTRFVAASYYFFDIGELLIFKGSKLTKEDIAFEQFHRKESLKIFPFLLLAAAGLFFGFAPGDFGVNRIFMQYAGFLFVLVYFGLAVRGIMTAWRGERKRIYDF